MIRHVAISTSTQNHNALGVTADANRPQTLLAFTLFSAGTCAVKFTDGTNDLTGAMPLVANGHVEIACSEGLCKAPAGTALNIHLSAAIAITGMATILVGEPTRQTL